MKRVLFLILCLTYISNSYGSDDPSKNRALNSADLNRLFFDDLRKQREEMNKLMDNMQRQMFSGSTSYSQQMRVKYKETKSGLDMIIPLNDPKSDQVKVEIKDRVITLIIEEKSDRGTSIQEQSFAIPARISPESPSFKQDGKNFIISFKKS